MEGVRVIMNKRTVIALLLLSCFCLWGCGTSDDVKKDDLNSKTETESQQSDETKEKQQEVNLDISDPGSEELYGDELEESEDIKEEIVSDPIDECNEDVEE